MRFEHLRAVILDWAGTTVDFGSLAPVMALRRVFAANGIEVTDDEVRLHMGALKKDHIRMICAGERVRGAWREQYGRTPDESDVERLFTEFVPRQTEILAAFSAPIPGVCGAIARWKAAGLRIGSTTGYTRELLDVVREAAAREGYAPDVSVTPDEACGGRPRPFMCYRNAMLLDVWPLSACVKIGDTPSDIAEGLNAGMWTVGITCTGNEVGLSREEWEKLPAAERRELEERAALRLAEAGAHFCAGSVAECDDVLALIEGRLAAGESPQREKRERKEKLLFTPGPLSTSRVVKQAMMRDLGSRDREFLGIVRGIRRRLLELAGAPADEYQCVLMQGSGTFGVESAVSSAIPHDGRLLVAVNGAYGQRIAQMARVHGIAVETLEFPERDRVDPEAVARRMEADPGITHVAAVHCETTTGMLNPIAEIGAAAHEHGAVYLVDAMSSFGAIPVDLVRDGIDFLVSSANKCIEGVPGFAFVLARRRALESARGQARSLSLDLHAQWAGLEGDGQFRFTPPTHALLAFDRALDELEREGGVAGRAARYRQNQEVLCQGMERLGFTPYLRPEDRSSIITTWRYPADPAFCFDEFYARLSDRGCVIYPGKVTGDDCFRIGTIGQIFPADIDRLIRAIEGVLQEMAVNHAAAAV
jgi:2-aminoethylphosphonate--pyruvate transaminase/phosphonoacetaldehyde hydrolase